MISVGEIEGIDFELEEINKELLKKMCTYALAIWVVNSSCQSVKVPKLSYSIANNSAGT